MLICSDPSVIELSGAIWYTFGMDDLVTLYWVGRDAEGNTLLHAAAKDGSLNRVPAGLLTMENMTMANAMGATPIHFAAWKGHLDQVPKEVITVETLLVKNGVGSSSLELAHVYRSQMDLLLGLDFPEGVKELVGEEWWEKNQVVFREKANLTVADEGAEVELF